MICYSAVCNLSKCCCVNGVGDLMIGYVVDAEVQHIFSGTLGVVKQLDFCFVRTVYRNIRFCGKGGGNIDQSGALTAYGIENVMFTVDYRRSSAHKQTVCNAFNENGIGISKSIGPKVLLYKGGAARNGGCTHGSTAHYRISAVQIG